MKTNYLKKIALLTLSTIMVTSMLAGCGAKTTTDETKKATQPAAVANKAPADGSLLEAARIDGCNEFKIFNKIVLPLIFPSVATMSIFTFINTWNNFLIPLILLFDPKKFTLPIMVMLARGTYKTEYGAVFAGVAISIVPIMIAFIFLSKKIVGGLTVGGVKG